MTLGSAICAAVGSGHYKTLAEAAEQMVRVETSIEPDPSRRELYDFYFEKYVASYPGLKGLMHQVSEKLESTD
jgi:sugar (pentulose or hexulose) kinase